MLPISRRPALIAMTATTALLAAAGALAAGSGVFVVPGAVGKADSALVYWTAPMPGSPLPAPAPNRPQTIPISLRPYAGGGQPTSYPLGDYSAMQVPAGTWMMSIQCNGRISHGIGETQFRFEAGRTYLLQCAGSPRRAREPRATQVDPPLAD